MRITPSLFHRVDRVRNSTLPHDRENCTMAHVSQIHDFVFALFFFGDEISKLGAEC